MATDDKRDDDKSEGWSIWDYLTFWWIFSLFE